MGQRLILGYSLRISLVPQAVQLQVADGKAKKAQKPRDHTIYARAKCVNF